MFGQGKSIYCDTLKPEPCIATVHIGDTPCNDWQFSVFSLGRAEVGFELFDRGTLPEWQFWRPNDEPAPIRFVHHVEQPIKEKTHPPQPMRVKRRGREPRLWRRLVQRSRNICAEETSYDYFRRKFVEVIACAHFDLVGGTGGYTMHKVFEDMMSLKLRWRCEICGASPPSFLWWLNDSDTQEMIWRLIDEFSCVVLDDVRFIPTKVVTPLLPTITP